MKKLHRGRSSLTQGHVVPSAGRPGTLPPYPHTSFPRMAPVLGFSSTRLRCMRRDESDNLESWIGAVAVELREGYCPQSSGIFRAEKSCSSICVPSAS
jgi:hypothetical protein